MMESLPEGASIGWMQAPPAWIFTHTARFVGVVRIVIQDGEGFILINRGEPRAYYFRHQNRELRGKAALDYFNSFAIIEFNLCKYTPEEFAFAEERCAAESVSIPSPESVPLPATEPEPVPKPVPETVPETVPEPAPELVPAPAEKPQVAIKKQRSIESIIASLWEEEPEEETPEEPVPEEQPEPEPEVIRQIRQLNGIIAVAIFNRHRTLLFSGDREKEPLMLAAARMLDTAQTINPPADWGAFIHMTLQMPEGNVIIAPWRENYLCLITTRTINIGHIRRILTNIHDRESAA